MEQNIKHITEIRVKNNEVTKKTKLNLFMIFWLLFIYKKGRKGFLI